MAAGASLEATDSHSKTALHWAARRGHATCMQLLLAAGAAVEATDAGGITALHQAAMSGCGACVQALLAAGARPEAAADTKGRTALHLATLYKRVSVVRCLLTLPQFSTSMALSA